MLPGMHLLTKDEQTKLFDIKARAQAGKQVSRIEKQWTLDIVKRVGAGLPTNLVAKARHQGYDVRGVVIDKA